MVNQWDMQFEQEWRQGVSNTLAATQFVIRTDTDIFRIVISPHNRGNNRIDILIQRYILNGIDHLVYLLFLLTQGIRTNRIPIRIIIFQYGFINNHIVIQFQHL